MFFSNFGRRHLKLQKHDDCIVLRKAEWNVMQQMQRNHRDHFTEDCLSSQTSIDSPSGTGDAAGGGMDSQYGPQKIS